MAIDSRDKRASVLGLGLASLLVLPQPTALDQGDRQQVAYCYRGITAQLPIVAEADVVITVAADDRTILVDGDDRTIRVEADDRVIATL